jgi:hypothetical protein
MTTQCVVIVISVFNVLLAAARRTLKNNHWAEPQSGSAKCPFSMFKGLNGVER